MSNTTTIAALRFDEHVKYIRRTNSDGFRHKYTLGYTERKELVKEVGVYCLVLFEYYLRMASTENTPITDEAAAEYFGWETHTAKRNRLKLIKHGWVSIMKTKQKNGRYIYSYYLGKDEVLLGNDI